MTANFDLLKETYPNEDRDTLFRNVLGGDWPDLIDDQNYENTCANRMSVALNESGLYQPAEMLTLFGLYDHGVI